MQRVTPYSSLTSLKAAPRFGAGKKHSSKREVTSSLVTPSMQVVAHDSHASTSKLEASVVLLPVESCLADTVTDMASGSGQQQVDPEAMHVVEGGDLHGSEEWLAEERKRKLLETGERFELLGGMVDTVTNQAKAYSRRMAAFVKLMAQNTQNSTKGLVASALKRSAKKLEKIAASLEVPKD